MTSPCPYHIIRNIQEAMQELKAESARSFDPAVIEALPLAFIEK